jgi:hypothetical protein
VPDEMKRRDVPDSKRCNKSMDNPEEECYHLLSDLDTPDEEDE